MGNRSGRRQPGGGLPGYGQEYDPNYGLDYYGGTYDPNLSSCKYLLLLFFCVSDTHTILI
jgi:hypothetical protein